MYFTITGWRQIPRDVYIRYHLETTPLEIRTDSVLESNDRVTVFFSTADGHYAGGLNLRFGTTIQYWLWDCSTTSNDLQVEPSATVEKIWRVKLTKTSGINLVIHCNGVEVLNTLVSDSECEDKSWRIDWNRPVEEVEFEVYDSASDYYRPVPGTACPCF